MKLVSWNVNGLRAVLNKGFLDIFNEMNADLFCLQEIKMQADQISFDFEGYHHYFHFAEKRGYSGVAVFSKKIPLNVEYGLVQTNIDNEGRVLTLEFDEFYLVNVYTPNSQRKLARLDFRTAWDLAFLEHILYYEQHKPVIVCGDLNVSHQEIDLANPKTNRNNAGFSDQERFGFQRLLDHGYIDTFRYFNPNKAEAYTWWSYMNNARERNIGWRIDYFLTSTKLESRLLDATIYDKVLGSDHCPIQLNIDFCD